MPKPTPYNITFVQGDTYRLRVRFKDADGNPIDITSWDFLAQVRATYDAVTPLAEFTATPDATIGWINLKLADTDTSDLAVSVLPDPTGYWDLEVTFPDGDVRTYITGKVTVKAQVSRA